MEQLPKIQSRADLQRSTPPSMNASAVKVATKIAEKILGAYPDYGKAPEGYLLSVTEFIAYQIPEVQEALAHPLTGIASKCKYLPTIADLKEFIEERARRLNTRATGYRYFKRGEGDPLEMADAERRKAAVVEALGYDPAKPKPTKRLPLDRGIMDAIQENRWSSGDLKTPAAPASEELKQLLREQGYVLPGDQEQAA